MKKSILLIAMLFSVAIFSQNTIELKKQKFEGLWSDIESENYYTVITYSEKDNFKFMNFSFIEDDTIEENLIQVENYLDTVIVKTKIQRENIPSWAVYAEYYVVDESTIEVIYTGDYNATHQLFRKHIK
tara:strand:- start:30 stop:416 length:387 start_codon:yes stop_codon:yes gene_type:complete